MQHVPCKFIFVVTNIVVCFSNNRFLGYTYIQRLIRIIIPFYKYSSHRRLKTQTQRQPNMRRKACIHQSGEPHIFSGGFFFPFFTECQSKFHKITHSCFESEFMINFMMGVNRKLPLKCVFFLIEESTVLWQQPFAKRIRDFEINVSINISFQGN